MAGLLSGYKYTNSSPTQGEITTELIVVSNTIYFSLVCSGQIGWHTGSITFHITHDYLHSKLYQSSNSHSCIRNHKIQPEEL